MYWFIWWSSRRCAFHTQTIDPSLKIGTRTRGVVPATRRVNMKGWSQRLVLRTVHTKRLEEQVAATCPSNSSHEASQKFKLVWIALVSVISGLTCKRDERVNKPFARSGHMVRNKLCCDANDTVGLSKQRKVGLDWYEFFCFGSPTALFASQCNLFRTMWPDPVKGLFCFVLTLSPRLCAFLNKGILDSRLNSNNSYSKD